MKSEALKIKKIEADALMRHDLIELTKELLHNPVAEIVTAAVLVAYLERNTNPILGSIVGAVSMSGITAVVGLQQLAPVLPALSQAMPGTITKLIGAAGG
jgi:hypothetical protein